MRARRSLRATALLATLLAFWQTPPARADGTLVLISGSAQLQVAHDEAVAQFFVELQDGELARAQSLVNQRAADGVAALRRADPKAQIETAGYQTYPLYGRDGARRVVGWRARQTVTLRTTDLASLPKTIAAAQQYLALAGIDFRLSRAARERVETELIQRALANLEARVTAAAQALDVPKSRIRIEELNFGLPVLDRPPAVPMARASAQSAEAVAEPPLDAGLSLQQMTVSARVRLGGN
ncbi:MAG: SIMPL domain-containing protein [Sutterellaceae bacterium]|nr:SIMPL domain-containing protein [Burkholderiaceae bacterium]MCX7900828.1 SIMPL domain-containing protein [Burkholderiaceae bacterium]MDW8429123.1 SIMPL domain-containing protein [Sutterellaceae bacterium]